MRHIFIHTTLLLLLTACNNKTAIKPVLLNKTATVQMPDDVLHFSSVDKNWNATLQSFIQPIPVKIYYHDTGFDIQLINNEGVTEGRAQIILNNDSQFFYYDVILVNKHNNRTEKDYRSPKTINPDSSLQQQRIIHQIDGNRNIVSKDRNFFKEEIITLSPSSGTFYAIANESLSAYYVQAGSCVSIHLKYTYNKEKKIFTVTADSLKDKYNNNVADGTVVAFVYSNGIQTFRREAALLNGSASVFIPTSKNKYTLFAKVNETNSNSINLIP